MNIEELKRSLREFLLANKKDKDEHQELLDKANKDSNAAVYYKNALNNRVALGRRAEDLGIMMEELIKLIERNESAGRDLSPLVEKRDEIEDEDEIFNRFRSR